MMKIVSKEHKVVYIDLNDIERMDYECNDPHKSNAPKLFTVKAKSKVGGAVSVKIHQM
jgi:hypothetical protein